MIRWFLFSNLLYYLNAALGQDHRDHTQQSFSASRLNELGEKWGIDVG